MYKISQPGGSALLLRKPDQTPGFVWQRHLYLSNRNSPTTYVLDNGRAKFTFKKDAGGAWLDSFERRFVGGSGHQWKNQERTLFKLLVHHTGRPADKGLRMFEGTGNGLSTPGVQNVADGLRLTFTWTGIKIDADSCNVVVTLNLKTGEDFLRAAVTFGWNTATTYALDSISLLPLRISQYPQQIGPPATDRAVVPAVGGIIVDDPIKNLIWNYGTYDANNFKPFFHGKIRNVGTYPSGNDICMGVWGYYDETSREGWSINLDTHQKVFLNVCWQSNRREMCWDCWMPQPDYLIPRNNDLDCLFQYTLDLRPFLSPTRHGWHEIGRHYSAVLDKTLPYFREPKLTDRETLDPFERLPYIFSRPNMGAANTDASRILTFYDVLRTAVGGSQAMGVFSIGNYKDGSNLDTPYQDPKPGTEDVRTMMSASRARNVFQGQHRLVDCWPVAFEKSKFKDSWNVWDDYDLLGAVRTSRQGKIDGDTTATKHGDSASTYHKQQQYVISSWNSSTKVLTVQGNPFTTDQWTRSPAFYCTLQWSDGGTLKLAAVTVIGNGTGHVSNTTNQVKLSGDPTDAIGTVRTPVGGLKVWLHDGFARLCPHAVMGAPSVMTFMIQAMGGGLFDRFDGCGLYFDLHTTVNRAPAANELSCSGAHGDWDRLSGYTRHPQGGGTWFLTAYFGVLKAIRDYIRLQHRNRYGTEIARLICEYVDETALPYLDVSTRAAGSGWLWRPFTEGGTDENGAPIPDTNPGCRAIPLMSLVHNGRVHFASATAEFSNGILAPTLGRGNATYEQKLRKAMGYWIAAEWVHGVTLASIAPFAHSAFGDTQTLNPWDESHYQPGHPLGQANQQIAKLRDLWSSLISTERSWAWRYMKRGEMQPPFELGGGTSKVSLVSYGLYDRDPAFGSYIDYIKAHGPAFPHIYPKEAFPRIVHAVWKDPERESVALLVANWSDAQATLELSAQATDVGISTGSAVLFSVDGRTGEKTKVGEYSGQINLTITLPAFSSGGFVFEPQSSEEQQQGAFWGLFPQGRLWTRRKGSILDRFVEALSAELGRVDSRVKQLQAEADPRSTTEMLEEWEELAGLPDECAPADNTLEQRRAALVARVLRREGQTVGFLQALIDEAGIAATVSEEYEQFTAGHGHAGDPLSNGGWPNTFQVDTFLPGAIYEFKAGDGCGRRLREWENKILECIVERSKPAHVLALVRYT